MQRILFICTGNIFRSLSAEWAVKLTLRPSDAISVISAGTTAEPKTVPTLVRQELTMRGADISSHVPRRLTSQLLGEATLPIAIGIDHQKFVKEQFGLSIPLLNELAHGDESSIPDLWEVYPDWRLRPLHMIEIYTRSTINHIFESIPPLLSRIGHASRPVPK